jgi:hypothetical protein
MYLGSILGYLSWPFLIGVSYLAVRWTLRIFERKREADGQEE